jgi:8-oxo-dGTP pyrophosphatase MutT (NUDIX family)
MMPACGMAGDTMSGEDGDWPPYCCVILVDEAGRYVMERRPPEEAARTGGLTCLGGGREANEHPDDCLRRELYEEIGWSPDVFERMATLTVGTRRIAWFYRAQYTGETPVHQEAGYAIELLSEEELTGERVGHWHRAVFAGLRRGETDIRIDP